MLCTSLNNNNNNNTTRCKIPARSLITHQLKEHYSSNFSEAWIDRVFYCSTYLKVPTYAARKYVTELIYAADAKGDVIDGIKS
jgi:hypothetical protein